MAFCSSFSSTLTILFILLTTPLRAAKEFKVGGTQGWRQPTANETEMYNKWTHTNRFHVGDSVRFEYKNDSVLAVDKWGYYHCNLKNPTSVFKDGNTTITLDYPGPIYFVSGNFSHCEDGQRLLIDVIPIPVPESPSPPQPDSDSPAPSPLSGVRPTSNVTTIIIACIAFFILLGVVWILPWIFVHFGLF